MRRWFAWVGLVGLLWAVSACATSELPPEEELDEPANNTSPPANNAAPPPECFDRDNDGFGRGTACLGPDCDDTDPTLNVDCSAACTDNDGDGYGEGNDCLGPDCDDNDRNVRPGAREICGNEVDDDCADGDEPCPVNCVDEDGDQYGEGDGCLGPDCDDTNPAINPDASELCNERDDNCDGQIDECASPLEVCDRNVLDCRGIQEASCARDSECLTGLVCENMVCLGTEGVDCDNNDQCADSFVCDNGRCIPDPDVDICEQLDCEAGEMVCLREQATCVECIEHFECPGVELCAGFTCNVVADRTLTTEETAVTEMSQFLADCFLGGSDDEVALCGILDAVALLNPLTEDEVRDHICDDAVAEDFVGGDRDLSAARGVVGCGLFNDDDLTWPRGLLPGSFWEICMWTVPPSGLFDERSVVVQPCEEFPAVR